MAIRLSQTSVTSFCGHVLPLSLISEADLSAADIRWESDSDVVAVRSFDVGRPCPVRHGVLLFL